MKKNYCAHNLSVLKQESCNKLYQLCCSFCSWMLRRCENNKTKIQKKIAMKSSAINKYIEKASLFFVCVCWFDFMLQIKISYCLIEKLSEMRRMEAN